MSQNQNDGRFTGFDTPEHRAAQEACNHMIRCAVDMASRRRVSADLDRIRELGPITMLPMMIAALTGPCCLPPASSKENEN